MRRLLAMVALVACGNGSEDQSQRVEMPAQPPLVIPPMDAGAPPSEPATDAEPAPAADPPADPIDPSDPKTAYMIARDPRVKTAPRSRALIIAELQGQETLLAKTTKSSPSRAELLRRLADGYAELARSPGAPHVVQPGLARSVSYATTLINDYPTYASLDAVRYYRALAYEQSHDLKNARSGYYDLIKNHPNSKFIPAAYFAFGEMFFDDAQRGDPTKYALASQAYKEVLKYPAATNPCHPLAKDRLASIPNGGNP